MIIISNRFINFVCNTLLKIEPQLSNIYLFVDVLYNKQLLASRQFREMFHDVYSLFEKIRCDIAEVKRFSRVTEGIQYISENAKSFWYQFFFNVLDHLQRTDISQRIVIPSIRAISEENSHEHRDINEFEREYQSDKVIW
jgi:hypothetical protein